MASSSAWGIEIGSYALKAVRLERNGKIVNGVGADTDIVCASAKAYLHALNLLESNDQRLRWQDHGV